MIFMGFKSILFNQNDFLEGKVEKPSYFRDLNLDQIISSIIASKKEYNLSPFFYSPLEDLGLIKYRTDVLKNLTDQSGLFDAIESFAKEMSSVRKALTFIDKLGYT